MNVDVSPFQLEGCQCRLKFDPTELQTLLQDELNKRVGKKAKFFEPLGGELVIEGRFTEIDEGNFALHFLLAFLGKAWISGNYRVRQDGEEILNESFHLNKTFAAFTNGKGQLKGDVKILADQIVKKTIKTLKNMN